MTHLYQMNLDKHLYAYIGKIEQISRIKLKNQYGGERTNSNVVPGI